MWAQLNVVRIFTLIILLSSCLIQFNQIECARVRLNPVEEPKTPELYETYRLAFSDNILYHLTSAGLIDQVNISHPLGTIIKRDKDAFKFNLNKFMIWESTLKWFIPLEERSALHVYDDPHEMDLATGPQVDQQLCGIHLDFMLNQIDKRMETFQDADEYSIWSIMHTFDTVRNGLPGGNSIFPGDYYTCKKNRLAVSRSDLEAMNKTAADIYFSSSHGFHAKQWSWLDELRHYVGPFLSYSVTESKRPIPMEKFKDKLRLVPMRYCFTGLRWPNWNNNTFYRRNMVLRLSACLPDTCDSKSLNIYRDKIYRLVDFNKSKFHKGYYIENLFCLPDEQSPLRNPLNYASTTMFIVFNVIWLTLSLIASMIYLIFRSRRKSNGKSEKGEKERLQSSEQSMKKKQTNWWFYLSSWAVPKNFNDFLGAKHGSSPNVPVEKSKQDKLRKVNFEPIEGVKVLGACSVICAHSLVILLSSSWNPYKGHYIISRSWAATTNVLGPANVDNFFVITGILTARTLLSSSRSYITWPSFWIKFMLYRYIRLVPMYFLVHWFLSSTFRFLGDGPFWDYATSHTAWAKVCQDESFWTIFLPTANFKSPAVHCNAVGWYLANDLQYILTTPFIMILLVKKAILGYIMIAIISILTMVNHTRYFLLNEPDPRGMFEWSLLSLNRITDDTTAGYVYPQYRCIAYIIGLGAGYLLDMYERDKIKKWPDNFVLYGKVFVLSMVYLFTFAPYVTTLLLGFDDSTLRIISSVFSGTVHGLTSVAVSIFLLLLTTGHMHSIARVLNARFLKIMANISLSTVLVHMPLLFYHNQSMQTLNDLSVYNISKTTFAWIMEAFFVSAIIHVLYELPLRRFLIKALIVITTRIFDKSSSDKNIKSKQS